MPTPKTSSHRTAADILGLKQHKSPDQSGSVEAEVDQYLNDPEQAANSLTYWQVLLIFYYNMFFLVILCLQSCEQRYPRIFPVAMDLLPVPASSVPCERIFSSAKETMAPRRNRITPDLMEALQLCKFSVKHGRLLDFLSCWYLGQLLLTLVPIF